MEVDKIVIRSGHAAEVKHLEDGDLRSYGTGSVAADVGAFLEPDGTVPDGIRIFALTHPACADLKNRTGAYSDIYKDNRVEIEDPLLGPPKGTVGYDVEFGGQRQLVVVLEDQLAMYVGSEQGPARLDRGKQAVQNGKHA